MRQHLTLLLFLILLPTLTFAQEDSEYASWVYLSASKPLTDRWSVSAQTELRTGKTESGMYLWYIDLGARYRLAPWLSASTGTDCIRIQSRTSGAWMTDWRPFVALTPSWSMGPLRANVNLCYSYNFFVEETGKDFHLMRYRLHVEYPIRDSRLTPFARLEIRQKPDRLERVRTTLGTSVKVSPRLAFDVAYIYQKMHHGIATHAVSLGYKLTLRGVEKL